MDTQLFNLLPEPALVVNWPDLRILAANQMATDRFGYSASEWSELNFEAIHSARDIQRLREAVAASYVEGLQLRGWRTARKDGGMSDIDLSVVRRDWSGAPALILMPLDAGPRREVEEQLRQAKKLEAVGMLAGGIAHDFNNLLTIISGYGQLLIGGLSEHDKSAMEQLLKASDRAAGLTRQLLAYSRRQELQPKPINLNEVVASMSPMLRRLIGEHIEIRINLGDQLGNIHADPGQIEQVVMNLAVNSRDAMANGGTLVIETSNCEFAGGVEQKADAPGQPGRFVLLSVSDTGVGMDEKTQERIFDPFFTTKGQGQGTGLGLSTVIGIIKQSGGTVKLYSEPGRGTSVKVYLPRVDGERPAPVKEQVVERSTPQEGRESILVVEDEDAVRKLVLATLERRGYRVLLASSGMEALHHARHFDGPIHLVITDLVMPQMGGAEVARRIRRIRPNIAILCMSGYTDRSIQRTRATGNMDFLQKPFTPNQLAEKVRQVLDQHPQQHNAAP